ncbi:MAG: hypothetical protein HKN56_02325 [Gammaproteobacteria bacterium]|nr:hypothetical protein [Gammaproteobacteria bacterium]NND53788.1 hypothetical protein [Gammaproteobacteria bacterium]
MKHVSTTLTLWITWMLAMSGSALADDGNHHNHTHSHCKNNGVTTHNHNHGGRHHHKACDGSGPGGTTGGEYAVGTTQYFFNDSTDTPMPAIVYYPKALADMSEIPAGVTFPATIFMQGGNVDGARYSWLEELATHGYIVVIPDINPVPTPNTDGSGTNPNTKLTSVDVLDRTVVNLHDFAIAPGSEIEGRFDGQIAISGHSLGAVMAIMSVDEQACLEASGAIGRCPPLYMRHPSIVALWMIGGHFENPNGPPDTRPINKPVDFPIYTISGSEDGHSTRDEILTTYNRYEEPKIFYEIAGANHLNWTDYLHPQDDIAKDLPATIEKEVQLVTTLGAVRSFLDCELKADQDACSAIPSSIPTL